MSLPTIRNVLFLYYSCLPALLMVFLSSVLPLALVVIIWYLVLPFIFVRTYLTFLTAVVLILKHATSLRFSMLPEPALIQADMDYQKADVNQKVQQYIAASQDYSAKLDTAFIMAVEIGSSILVSVWIIQSFHFKPQEWQVCVYKRDCWFLELGFSHMSMIQLCWCEGG